MQARRELAEAERELSKPDPDEAVRLRAEVAHLTAELDVLATQNETFAPT